MATKPPTSIHIFLGICAGKALNQRLGPGDKGQSMDMCHSNLRPSRGTLNGSRLASLEAMMLPIYDMMTGVFWWLI